MRIVVVAFVFAFTAIHVVAQPAPLAEPMVRHICGAPQLSSGSEFDEVAAVAHRLGVTNRRIHIAVAYSPVVNAWEVELSADASLVCIPVGLVHFMGDVEGQLAFFLAHEFGHAIDDLCKTLAGRSKASSRSGSGAILALIFGHSNGDGAGDQRACEDRADELGFNLMARAGYDPEDAAAAFRRLSIYLGDTATGPFARLAALGNDHPITPDRIRHIRKLITRQEREKGFKVSEFRGFKDDSTSKGADSSSIRP